MLERHTGRGVDEILTGIRFQEPVIQGVGCWGLGIGEVPISDKCLVVSVKGKSSRLRAVPLTRHRINPSTWLRINDKCQSTPGGTRTCGSALLISTGHGNVK